MISYYAINYNNFYTNDLEKTTFLSFVLFTYFMIQYAVRIVLSGDISYLVLKLSIFVTENMPKIQVVATSGMIPTTGYQLSRTNDFANHKNSNNYSNALKSNSNGKSETNCMNHIKFFDNQKGCSELSSCHIKEWLEEQIKVSAKHDDRSSRILGLLDLLQNSGNDFSSTKKEITKTVFITNQF